MAKEKSLEERVAAGAKLLDKKMPGWETKIKRTTIKMNSNEVCILGQLGDGDAEACCKQLGLNWGEENDAPSDTVKYGFETEDVDDKHAKLWKKEIAARLEKNKE